MVVEALDVDNYLFVADGLVGAVCQELVFLVVILSSHDLATTFLHLHLEKGFHYSFVRALLVVFMSGVQQPWLEIGCDKYLPPPHRD